MREKKMLNKREKVKKVFDREILFCSVVCSLKKEFEAEKKLLFYFQIKLICVLLLTWNESNLELFLNIFLLFMSWFCYLLKEKRREGKQKKKQNFENLLSSNNYKLLFKTLFNISFFQNFNLSNSFNIWPIQLFKHWYFSNISNIRTILFSNFLTVPSQEKVLLSTAH